MASLAEKRIVEFEPHIERDEVVTEQQQQSRPEELRLLEALLFAHIDDRAFPCVGAKSAMARGTLDVLACSSIDSAWDDVRIHDALMRLAEDYRRDRAMYRSFAVVFEGPGDLSEPEFERALWQRVQSLSDKDVWRGQDYDARGSADPDNPHFSLSFGGEAFFIRIRDSDDLRRWNMKPHRVDAVTIVAATAGLFNIFSFCSSFASNCFAISHLWFADVDFDAVGPFQDVHFDVQV